MNTTTTSWPGPNVIQPGIERPTAMRLAETWRRAHSAMPDHFWPPRPRRWPTRGTTHHAGPFLSARSRTMTMTSTVRRGSAEK